ncbi:TatD family hydrolase [Aquicella lusitana]|uniref:TatD DNase family protein n=1 Tax=Aquicella lusitana TaxID=254246 RepID=A0A370GRS0_9COXI|nr:TatD family hydrolase [Aquicella lusitana]RDI46020.1 TatD DNase family protein [Aquicella lusitana]VVC73383.1 putative deoxyribonuclease YcfH [Aquicella lusitana]
MFLVDSHCHLDLLDLTPDEGDLNRVIARAQEQGVHYLLNVCVALDGFPTLLKTAERYPFVSTSVGLHPNENPAPVTDVDETTLIRLAQHPKVVAIGETGLDYFRSTGDLEWQRTRFRTHIEAAKKVGKPLIVHTRDAKDDTIRIMKEERADQVQGVMHCFTEDWAMAKKALDMNFYISFSGIVTFKSAVTLQDVARQVPLDRILIETDCPYLAPNPHRGKPNEPAYVRYTADYIAKLRNISLETFAEQTTKNFFTLFSSCHFNRNELHV